MNLATEHGGSMQSRPCWLTSRITQIFSLRVRAENWLADVFIFLCLFINVERKRLGIFLKFSHKNKI
jgi:hypothetical protein